MKTIFIVPTQESYFGILMTALTEDGDCIAEHMSSNIMFGKQDMGIGTTDKHEFYDKEYGAGNWQLKYADEEVVKSDEFKLAVQRNYDKYLNELKSDECESEDE